MFSMQEIRSQVNSIQSIKKIAKVMEMVALSKMKKTQQRMLASRPYTDMIRKVITHVALGNLEYKHPYLTIRKIRRVGYLVISTDRGLAGSLNINVFKKVLCDIENCHSEGIEVSLFLIGAKACAFFSFMKEKIVNYLTGIGDNPGLSELISLVKSILELYDACYLDKIYLIFNKFKNVLSQVPHIFQILPLLPFGEQQEENLKNKFWDYLYEPDPKILLDTLLVRYIELQIYQGVVENLASEQAARMVAMKSAFDNAENIMRDLKLIYNKVRQTKITQELIEIISGSIAVI
ncbi:F0F1 ATP synthase subunit gamma [Blochmannia endosymbiont of Polyrhachis (Hedomyrma) turneri]|uniref:F0F1 ATP synthase subunit gamma n=1 Tax=Blochmannia endosymbiont of Polyrhachis (Hedomyrma) turneri TaxID=1505596 RepID=UPI00061A5FF2|nr:F0F1 ATP synthase subunit gamma [Blochmannia endosymbiont of Polyrhachis (Hedomyrma) turneri]AKC59603.1 ATP synthase gamma chain [Blochmannia endosymbiont of Polyrhachis (Hedomyrma) turneri]